MYTHTHTHTYIHTHTHTHTHAHTHAHTHPPHTGLTVKHFPVRWNGVELSFGVGKFSTVEDILDHFESKFGTLGNTSIVCTLHTYYTIHELGSVNYLAYVVSKLS